VFADPEEPPRCDCGPNAALKEITDDVQAESYFTELRDIDT
jgi:hypothetical protein